jgi:hypothetical protein
MSRALNWHRFVLNSGLSSVAGQCTASPVIAVNSTIIRVRFSLQISHIGEPALANFPASMVTYGLVLTYGFPPPVHPDPFANPDADWMWYEGVPLRLEEHNLTGASYPTMYGPAGDAQRDVEAQRKVTAPDVNVVWAFNSGFNSPIGSIMDVAYSILVMDPP